jgi:hypothetical protein
MGHVIPLQQDIHVAVSLVTPVKTVIHLVSFFLLLKESLKDRQCNDQKKNNQKTNNDSQNTEKEGLRNTTKNKTGMKGGAMVG